MLFKVFQLAHDFRIFNPKVGAFIENSCKGKLALSYYSYDWLLPEMFIHLCKSTASIDMRRFILATISLFIALSSLGQTASHLAVTLKNDSAGKVLKSSWYQERPFLIEVKNTGAEVLEVLERLIINREDDNDINSNIYIKADVAEKNGWKPLSFTADVDIWVDPIAGVPTKRLKPGEKITLRCNPFTYFAGFPPGKHEYRIKCFYRIRQKGKDMVYTSNDVRLFIQIPESGKN